MIRFACPSCSAVFTATDDKGGKIGTCSKCQTQFVIPPALASAPVAPPPPPPPRLPPPPPPKLPPRAEPAPPRVKASSAPAAPVAKVIRVDDEPRRPRREDDDDHPRRRPRDDDDDDYDDDYDRPRRKKKSKTSGLILGMGIALTLFSILVVTISIIDITKYGDSIGRRPSISSAQRNMLPPDVRSSLENAELAMVFLQIFMYTSLLAGIAMITAGIGFIVHQKFGLIASFINCGLSAVAAIGLAIALIMLNNVTGGPKMSDSTTFGFVVRFFMHVVPIILIIVTASNRVATMKLK